MLLLRFPQRRNQIRGSGHCGVRFYVHKAARAAFTTGNKTIANVKGVLSTCRVTVALQLLEEEQALLGEKSHRAVHRYLYFTGTRSETRMERTAHTTSTRAALKQLRQCCSEADTALLYVGVRSCSYWTRGLARSVFVFGLHSLVVSLLCTCNTSHREHVDALS